MSKKISKSKVVEIFNKKIHYALSIILSKNSNNKWLKTKIDIMKKNYMQGNLDRTLINAFCDIILKDKELCSEIKKLNIEYFINKKHLKKDMIMMKKFQDIFKSIEYTEQIMLMKILNSLRLWSMKYESIS